MSQVVQPQHPAVVLRSHYVHMRALLAVAMVAVAGLTTALVVVATDDDTTVISSPAVPLSAPSARDDIRYDGGPEEGTRGILPAQPSGTRFDGGPEEGTRGVLTRSRVDSQVASGTSAGRGR